MPPNLKRKQMDNAYEDRIQAAITEWQGGLFKSRRAAAIAQDLPSDEVEDAIPLKDTDSDDFDYEPPQGHVPDSRQPFPTPAVPASSVHISPDSPPLSSCFAHIERVSVTQDVSPADDMCVNSDSSPLPSDFTRSRNASSSSAMSISIALDPIHAPIPNSLQEKNSEISRLRMTVELLERELALARAESASKKAH